MKNLLKIKDELMVITSKAHFKVGLWSEKPLHMEVSEELPFINVLNRCFTKQHI